MKRKSQNLISRMFRKTNSRVVKSRRDGNSNAKLSFERLEGRQLLAGDFLSAIGTGGTQDDVGKSIATDGAGNFYTTGYFESSVALNPAAPLNLTTSAGAEDVFVTKYNVDGVFQWAKRIGGTQSDKGTAIAVDSSGNVLIGGGFRGSVDFDSSPTKNFLMSSTGTAQQDTFIVKLNTSGNFLWAKQFSGPKLEVINSINVDNSGNVVATGSFIGTVDFDPSSAVSSMTSGATDVANGFVVKLTSNGNFVWKTKMNGIGFSESTAVDTDAPGNVYTTGWFSGTTAFGATSLTSQDAIDAFVMKQNSMGNIIWVKQFKGNGNQAGTGIAVDETGNVFSTGAFEETTDFDPGAGTQNLFGISGSEDIYLSKLDSAGNYVWAKRMGGFGADFGIGIAVDSNGGVYTTGTFTRTSNFNPGTTTSRLISRGGTDVFVTKHDSGGSFIWARQMGGTSEDTCESIAIDFRRNILTTGSFFGTANFDPNGTFELSAGVNPNIFNSRLTQEIVISSLPPRIRDIVIHRNGTNIEVASDITGGVVLLSRPMDQIFGVRVSSPDASNVGVDYAFGGQFSLTNGIRVDTGRPAGFRVFGSANEYVSYLPRTTATGATNLMVFSSADSGTLANIELKNVNLSRVVGVNSLYYLTLNSADLLNANGISLFGEADAIGFAGTSGGVESVPLLVYGVPSMTIDLASADVLGSANDRFTIDEAAFNALGLRNLNVHTGEGEDELAVNAVDLSLRVAGGAFRYFAGNGIDTLNVAGDADYTVDATSLRSSLGGRIDFGALGIETAQLTGGVNANVLDASAFTGTAIMYGLGGNDKLIGSNQRDYLFGGAGNDAISGRLGNDFLYGQGGADTLYFYGGTGHDELDVLRTSSTNGRFRNLPFGEVDFFQYDALDNIRVDAGGGDDMIFIDAAFTILGNVNGGVGFDICTKPAAWTSANCEG